VDVSVRREAATLTENTGWYAPPASEYDFPAAPFNPFGPEPLIFPAPRDPFIQDRVEATAAQIQHGFPYRTLLDCRELAARLVDEVLTWDAMWPEAEGDLP
jgi:hypothetical protein